MTNTQSTMYDSFFDKRFYGKKFYRYLVPGGKDYRNSGNTLYLSKEYIDSDDYFIIAKDIFNPDKNKLVKCYAGFRNYLDYIIWFLTVPEHERCFYEIIRNSRQKFRVDLDLEIGKHEGITKDNYLDIGNATSAAVISAYEQVALELNIKFNRNKVIFTTSTTDIKFSEHQIYDGYYHHNKLEAKALYDLIITKIDPRYRPYVDHSIYSDNQAFRLPFNKKINKNNIKNINWRKCTWAPTDTVNPSDPAYYIFLHEASLVTFTNNSVAFPSLVSVEEERRSVNINTIDASEYYNDMINAFNSSEFANIYKPDRHSTDNKIICTREKPAFCTMCKRKHDSDNGTISVSERGNIYFRCRRNSTAYTIIGRTTIIPAEPLEDDDNAAENTEVPEPLFPNHCTVVEISQDYLSIFPTNEGILAVKSPMETGKTVQSFNYLRTIIEREPELNAVVVSNRRSYTNDIHTRLNNTLDVQFSRYDNTLPLTYEEKRYYITQVESLHKDDLQRGIVFFDEFKSILAQFNSPLHRDKMHLNRQVLEEYIKYAKYILLLDADLDSDCLEFIHSIRPDVQINVIHNTIQKRQDYTIVEYYNLYEFVNAMSDSFRDPNNNVVIPTNSKSFGNIVKALFPYRNIKYYSSSEDDRPEELANLNNVVTQFNTLIYTPTISSGNDINVQHFHEMFAYVSPQSCCARDFNQMIGRVRHLQNRTIHLLIGDQEGHQPTTYQSILNDITTKIRTNKLARRDFFQHTIMNDTVRRLFNGRYQYRLENNIWTVNCINNIIERNKSFNNMRSELLDIFSKQGYQHQVFIGFLEGEELQSVKQQYKECKAAVKNNKISEWMNARIVNPNVAKALQHQVNINNASKLEKVELNKFKILSKFTSDTPHESLAIIANDKKYHSNIRNCVAERRLTPSQLIAIDSLKNPLFSSDKFLHNKVNIIHRLCFILGISSSFDTETTINPSVIIPFYSEIAADFPMWKRLFHLRGGGPNPSKSSSYMTSIASVIKAWNGCSLKRTGKHTTDPYKIYPFIDNIHQLVFNYDTGHISDLSIETTVDVLPEMNNITTNIRVDNNVTYGTITLSQVNNYYRSNHSGLTLNIIRQ